MYQLFFIQINNIFLLVLYYVSYYHTNNGNMGIIRPTNYSRTLMAEFDI